MKSVDLKDIDRSGPPKHDALSEALIERIISFKEILNEVETMPLEQILYNFRCDRNPENEVIIWESIAKNYKQYILSHPELALEVKMDIFRQLLVNSLEEKPVTVVKKENTIV